MPMDDLRNLLPPHLQFWSVNNGRLKPQCSDDDDSQGEDTDLPAGSTQTLVRPDEQVRTPAMYKVVILNDDFTPRDFIVHILMRFFGKTETDANNLMLQVHHKGSGVAGVFTYEIAETKTYQVNQYAKQNQFPLKCVMEEE